MENIDFEAFAKKAAQIAADKKALDIRVLDVRDLTAIANYFVVICANSMPQINAVCDAIEDDFKKDELFIVRKENSSSQNWRVLDYGGIIIHIMSQQTKMTYKIEEFWKNAKEIKFEEERKEDINEAVKELIEKIRPEIKKIIRLKKSVSVLKKKVKKSVSIVPKKVKLIKKKTIKTKKKVKSKIKKQAAVSKRSIVKIQKKANKTLTARSAKKIKKPVKNLGKGARTKANGLLKKKKVKR